MNSRLDDMPILSVGVLPWLDIKEPIVVGEIIFLPAAHIDEMFGTQAAILQDRLRIYRDTFHDFAVHCTVALHERQITVGGKIPSGDYRRAVDILMVSAMFRNDGTLRQQNATTFTAFIHGLGGESGFIAPRTRRRNQGFITGMPTTVGIPKPLYAAEFSSYDERILHALVKASQLRDAPGRLFDSLAWLRRASTDADNVEVEVDYVLLLTAFDFLLASPKHKGPGPGYARIVELLTPFTSIPCCGVIKSRIERSQIEVVLFVLNEIRNTAVHPKPGSTDVPYGFTRAKTAFGWVVDRCYMALLAARLVELGCLEIDEEVRAFIEGVQHWIPSPGEDVGHVIIQTKLRNSLREAYMEMHDREVTNVPKIALIDPKREQWAREFFLAVGELAERWAFEVVWLESGSGEVLIYEQMVDERKLRDSMPFHPDENSSTQMAHAALVYPDDMAPYREPNEPTQDEKWAMQNPHKWISGSSEPG